MNFYCTRVLNEQIYECEQGGHPVSPGYLWQLVRGGVYPENLWLQLVWEGLSVIPGGPLEKNLKL